MSPSLRYDQSQAAISDMVPAMGRLSPISSVIHSKFSIAFTITYISADT